MDTKLVLIFALALILAYKLGYDKGRGTGQGSGKGLLQSGNPSDLRSLYPGAIIVS